MFYLELRYDQLFENTTAGGNINGISGTAQKAGNISQLAWRVRGRDRQAYNFTYDHLSRLKTATYYDVNNSNTATNTGRFNETLAYDIRGNIDTLRRNGFYSSTCGYGEFDFLKYTYTSNTNRISKIKDHALLSQKMHGFNPGTDTTGYTYDANGNLKSDSYKGISNISYNHLNLPSVITYSNGNSIQFVYDAAGMKLRKVVKVGATVQYEQSYLGGLEYRKNGTGSTRVEAVYHAEGRYLNLNAEVNNTLSWQKEYTIRDHLGNARVTFTDKNLNGIVDITNSASTNDIIQENHNYPFGMNYEGPWLMNDVPRDNKYQYNKKEFNDDFGLNLSDYGARFYDAAIGKFTTIDRFSDKYSSYSPYSYAANNPIRNIDINGDSVWVTSKTSQDANGQQVITQTIHVRGKVLDLSGVKKGGGGCSRAKDGREDLATGINNKLNSQRGLSSVTNDQRIEIRFDAQFSVANSMDEVGESDHLIVVVDDVLGGADSALGGGDAGGLGSTPGKISYVKNTSNMEFLIDASVHEFGHNMGLGHVDNGTGNIMSYDSKPSGFTNSQMSTMMQNGAAGDANRGSNRQISTSTTSNRFFHTSTNEQPWAKNTTAGQTIPRILKNPY